MLKSPTNCKFKKSHKRRIRAVNLSKKGCVLHHGIYGLKCLKAGRLFYEQIEAARRRITRNRKKKATVWIRLTPDRPITQKPKEIRRGKGKGAVSHWVHRLESGKILFEISGVCSKTARRAFFQAGKKLPFPTVRLSRPQPPAVV